MCLNSFLFGPEDGVWLYFLNYMYPFTSRGTKNFWSAPRGILKGFTYSKISMYYMKRNPKPSMVISTPNKLCLSTCQNGTARTKLPFGFPKSKRSAQALEAIDTDICHHEVISHV